MTDGKASVRRALRRLALSALVLAASGCLSINVQGDPEAGSRQLRRIVAERIAQVLPLRVATYNVSLYSDEAGGLARRLRAGDADARRVAAVLQRVRPDIVLLNEFDHDAAGEAADLFQREYLERPQGDSRAIRYPYRYFAPVNTGLPSGFDLDRNGRIGGSGRDAGNDAWGFGLHPGQYGMLVLSKYPIDRTAVRTFRDFRWRALPGALAPVDPKTRKPWYAQEAWAAMPLSSKSHWDVPIDTPQGRLHLLASHPTPPVFDGAEDRNGRRNHDEVRFWNEYLASGARPWLCDDGGHCGGLAAGAQFVLVGDLNADPDDGDGLPGAIRALLANPRVQSGFVPRSEGAAERAKLYGLPRRGAADAKTGDFGPKGGTLRLDYVLPSRGLAVMDGAVFWPPASSPDSALAGGSDHRLVWLDLMR